MLTRLSLPETSGSGECVGSGGGSEKSGSAPIGGDRGEIGVWVGSVRELRHSLGGKSSARN